MKTVLVAVLKSKDDLRILLKEKWYRIPVAFLPRKKFTHIAFYEPMTGFGKAGKRVRYYARVSKREVKKRVELLPSEPAHPRAEQKYVKFSFCTIERLEKPIRNVIPRRVSFGFTDLKTLRSARDILQLYHVAPTEQIIERELSRLGIPVTAQYRLSLSSPLVKGALSSSAGGMSTPPFPSSVEEGWPEAGVVVSSARGAESARRGGGVESPLTKGVSESSPPAPEGRAGRTGVVSSPSFKEGDKRGSFENKHIKHFRLDLAVFCKNGNLAIECDNRKAHSTKLQKLKDKQKDLALKKLGWRVIRLTESEILENLDSCILRITKAITLLGCGGNRDGKHSHGGFPEGY